MGAFTSPTRGAGAGAVRSPRRGAVAGAVPPCPGGGGALVWTEQEEVVVEGLEDVHGLGGFILVRGGGREQLATFASRVRRDTWRIVTPATAVNTLYSMSN